MFRVEAAASGAGLETQLWRDELQLDGDDVSLMIRLRDGVGNTAGSWCSVLAWSSCRYLNEARCQLFFHHMY